MFSKLFSAQQTPVIFRNQPFLRLESAEWPSMWTFLRETPTTLSNFDSESYIQRAVLQFLFHKTCVDLAM